MRLTISPLSTPMLGLGALTLELLLHALKISLVGLTLAHFSGLLKGSLIPLPLTSALRPTLPT